MSMKPTVSRQQQGIYTNQRQQLCVESETYQCWGVLGDDRSELLSRVSDGLRTETSVYHIKK